MGTWRVWPGEARKSAAGKIDAGALDEEVFGGGAGHGRRRRIADELSGAHTVGPEPLEPGQARVQGPAEGDIDVADVEDPVAEGDLIDGGIVAVEQGIPGSWRR